MKLALLAIIYFLKLLTNTAQVLYIHKFSNLHVGYLSLLGYDSNKLHLFIRVYTGIGD